MPQAMVAWFRPSRACWDEAVMTACRSHRWSRRAIRTGPCRQRRPQRSGRHWRRRWRRGATCCSASGAPSGSVSWRCWTPRRARWRSRAGHRGRLSLGRLASRPGATAGTGGRRPLRADRRGRRRRPPLARSWPLGYRPSARRGHAAAAASRPMPSCRSRARACIRCRSARSMPASSSPAISASPPRARPWCGWRRGLAISTRGSTG